MRIQSHPILDFQQRKKLAFSFNAQPLVGEQGDTIASALHAAGITTLTHSVRYDSPRGFFCGIGKCSSCLMRVNGIPNVRTCIAPLHEGIRVETQGTYAGLPDAEFQTHSKTTIRVDVLVVGAGPAGLCAAVEAASQGATVLLVDENPSVGGQLIKQTHKFFGSKKERAGTRGIHIATELEGELRGLEQQGHVRVMTEATVIGCYERRAEHHRFGVVQREQYTSYLYDVQCRAAIIACGAMENMVLFPGNDLPGVYGAGAVQTLMNVYGVKPGNRVLMVGAGNVGLIVSYQLLQAGIAVDRVVEAAPIIGGYHVHAAKLRRCGVPIHTSHSIKEVLGDDKVQGAVVVALDEHWRPKPGSEERITCDTICLAVGLTPSTRLLAQIGAHQSFIPEAGGTVAVHDQHMQTSIKGVYVAGDASGIEEASTAMIEGKIAGLAAAVSLGRTKNQKLLSQYHRDLEQLRAGPFGEKPRIAKTKITQLAEVPHARV
ncbi:MAG: FAD-dependent oxidoreductase [Candidatus Thermoplasmatota archaeon]|nr:FAD-dependent oxidoreductase [Candidatus Thermoplasmatota archaeon]